MTDHLSKDKRSWNMSLIKNKHSKPEVIIRSLLHVAGVRFRINVKKLPGNPDIVISRHKIIIFVHGCFWHRHKNCKKATSPKTNDIYWVSKFKRNVERDFEVKRKLGQLGWQVIVLWECEILKDPYVAAKTILDKMDKSIPVCYYEVNNKGKIIKVAEARSKYLINKDKSFER